MRHLRMMVVGFMAAGVITVLSSLSYADEAQDQATVKNLNAAAAALQQSNPALAASLTQFANKEAVEKEGENKGGRESEGMKESAMMNKRMAHIKLLRESASALKQSNPELALTLMQMADRSENRMMNKQQGEKSEKEDSDTGSAK